MLAPPSLRRRRQHAGHHGDERDREPDEVNRKREEAKHRVVPQPVIELTLPMGFIVPLIWINGYRKFAKAAVMVILASAVGRLRQAGDGHTLGVNLAHERRQRRQFPLQGHP